MNPADYYTKMDITSYKQRGAELLKAINREIKPYSKGSLMQLPSVILMTQNQYDDLMELGGLENVFHSEDKLLITPYNVMEVQVKNRKKLLFTEVQQLDNKQFNEWEKANGQKAR